MPGRSISACATSGVRPCAVLIKTIAVTIILRLIHRGATLADAYRFRSRYATNREERGRSPCQPAKDGDNPVPLPGALSPLLHCADSAPPHVVRIANVGGASPDHWQSVLRREI